LTGLAVLLRRQASAGFADQTRVESGAIGAKARQ